MITGNKERLILIGSVLLNVFLIAFIAGRMSLMPPPPPPPHGMHGHMPPPPMVGPGELFSPGEMRADMDSMKANFDKVRQARKAFAQKMKDGPVTKEEVLAHFNQVDQLMSQIRDNTQEKMAEKISSLTPEQRQRFAERFERPRHGGPGSHRGPGSFKGRGHSDRDDQMPPPPEGDAPPPPPEE